ncbi:MAG TPA: branched-chain amino acid ABC transporter permease [Trueperaceae bacterium]|nr:branched-chain amino acid ABC transporter permease [Trueperaceae bacterium]
MSDPTFFARSALLAVPLYLLLVVVLRGTSAILKHAIAVVAALALAVALVLMLPPGSLSYFTTFLLMGSVYAVLTLGLNVQWGYTGLFNIGIAAFFAIGAFTSALVTTVEPTGSMAAFTQQLFGLGAPFWVGLLAAGLASGLLALIVGGPTLRLRGDYLAIATIGIGELVRLVFQNERWLANGPQPLRGLPQPLSCLASSEGCSYLPGFVNAFFEPLSPREYPYIYVAIVAIVLFLVYVGLERAIRSPWGRVLRAVREDEDSAAMSGKNVAAFRMQAFVVGAVIMGIGGSLYAHYVVAIDYGHFDPLYGTFLIWVMLMLGGSGNNRGAVLGALLVWAIWTGASFAIDALRPTLASISPELPQRGPYVRFLLISLLMLFIVLYRPRGVLPEEKVVSLARD